MILCIHCAGSKQLPENYKEEVELRLRNFFFVGIANEYSRSLRLFHELSNRGTVPNDVESFPMRTSNHDKTAFLKENLVYEDPIDAWLYQLARQIFAEEIEYVKQWKQVVL